MKHYILNVDYSEDRLECVCGAVMKAQFGADWNEHKLAASRPQVHNETPPRAEPATPASRAIPVRDVG